LAVDQGLEQARRWGAQALVFANLTPQALRRWTAVRPGGTAILLDLTYDAPLGGSVEAFLSTWRAKIRRELVRQWRRAVDAGVHLRILPGQEMAPFVEEFAELTYNAASKHGVNIYGPEMFAHLLQVPGAVLLAAEHTDRMVGGFYCYLHRGRFAMSTGGLDYSVLRELNTYAFLMYESLHYAARHGAEIVDLGRANCAYKERHGFRGTELWSLVYLTHPEPGVVDALRRVNQGMTEQFVKYSRADED
jgi:predicted N-acyltransferase